MANDQEVILVPESGYGYNYSYIAPDIYGNTVVWGKGGSNDIDLYMTRYFFSPFITEIFPQTASAGSLITLTGKNFGYLQEDSEVILAHGIFAPVVSWSDTEITFTIPDGAQSGDLKVMTHGGDSNNLPITIYGPPRPATLVSPSGTISIRTPTYIWNAVEEATVYLFWIERNNAEAYHHQYTAAEVGCAQGEDTCSVTPDVELSEGRNEWLVRTKNEWGWGPWSYAMEIFIEDTVPEVPSDLTATLIGTSEVDLTWQDNSDNELHFSLGWSLDQIIWSGPIILDANTTSYHIDYGLGSDGKTFYYRIRALGMAGNSEHSNIARVTLPWLRPDAPSNLVAIAISSSQIDLSWDDNSDNEDGFYIERKVGNGSFSQIVTLGSSIRRYIDRNLTATVTYSYRVRACNEGGNSAYSNRVRVSPSQRPLIRSRKPSRGKRGDIVLIRGRNFLRKNSASRVIFYNSKTIKSSKVLSWSNKTIKCKVPRLPKGRYKIRVINQRGQSNNKGFRLR